MGVIKGDTRSVDYNLDNCSIMFKQQRPKP